MATDALYFNNTGTANSYFTFPGPAIPNADWCIGFWIRPDLMATSPSPYQYLVSIGSLGTAGSLQLFLNGAQGSSGCLFLRFMKDGGTAELNNNGSMVVLPTTGSGTDYLMVCQCRAGTLEYYVVPEGASSVGTVTTNPYYTGWGSIAAKTWYIGGRSDLSTARFTTNPLGELFFLSSSSLTSAEVLTLASGKHITAVRSTPAVDLRFRGNNATETNLGSAGGVATRQGTNFSLVNEFFPNSVNTAPVAVADTKSTNYKTAITFDPRTNDTDANGDALSVISASLATGSGTVSFTSSSITYTPANGFSGTATINYQINDGYLASNTAVVTVTVSAAANTAPVANADTKSTAYKTPITFDPRTNDTDAQGNTLSVNSATLTTGSGTVSYTATSITYTPSAGFSGNAVINYTVSDGSLTSNTSTCTITVGANTAPVAVNDTSTTAYQTAVTFDPRTNDSDANGESISVNSATLTSGSGTVSFTATGITYTPANGFSGTAVVSYTVSDGYLSSNTATWTITVAAAVVVTNISSGKTATASSTESVTYYAPGNVTDGVVDSRWSSNYSDPQWIQIDLGTTYTVTRVEITWANTGGTNYLVQISSDGTNWTTLATETAGTVNTKFTYNVSGSGRYVRMYGTARNTTYGYSIYTFDVFGYTGVTNTAPTTVAENRITRYATSITFDPRTNDTDAQGDALSVNSAVLSSGSGTVNYTASSITFIPAAGFQGSATINYTVSDGSLTSNTSSDKVIVENVRYPSPTVTNDSKSTPFNVPITFDPRTNDFNTYNDPLYVNFATLVSGNGTVTSTPTSITYTPAAGFIGNAVINYFASTGWINDGATTAPGDLIRKGSFEDGSIGMWGMWGNTVAAVSGQSHTKAMIQTGRDGVEFPYWYPDIYGIAQYAMPVTTGDVLVGMAKICSLGVNYNCNFGLCAFDSAGNVVSWYGLGGIGPNTDWTTVKGTCTVPSNWAYVVGWTQVDMFTTLTVGAKFSNMSIVRAGSGTVTVSVGSNTAPNASADTTYTTKNTPVTFNVLTNDTDAEGNTLTVTAASVVSGGGTVSFSSPNVTYTPATDYVGQAVVNYTVSDGSLTSTTTLTITVNPSKQRALTLINGKPSRIPDSQLATPGNKFLVLYNGKMKYRTASEGVPLVIPNGKIRCLSSSETLESQSVSALPITIKKWGVNLSSLEFGDARSSWNYSHDLTEIAYWGAGKIIRLPFRWERIQPTLGGALDTAYLQIIKDTVAAINTAGSTVILDMHNFGEYKNTDGVAYKVGTSTVTAAHLADVWGKIAQVFTSLPGIEGYDFMNEPVNMPAGTWFNTCQSVINAIRVYDTARWIYVEGENWSGAATWPQYNDGLKLLTDSQNKLIFSAHTYLDRDNSGTHFDWPTELLNGSYYGIGVARISVFMNWLNQNGLRGHIGELGAGAESGWLQELETTAQYCHDQGLQLSLWSAGNMWGSYPYSVTPDTYQTRRRSRPQIGVLRKVWGESGGEVFDDGPFFGTKSQPTTITVYLRGWLSSPLTINLAVNGGTLSSSSVTLPAGLNPSVTYTVTVSTDYSSVTHTGGSCIITYSRPDGGQVPPSRGYSVVPAYLDNLPTSMTQNLYGMRRLRSTYAGQCLRLRRSSDNAESDFGFTTPGYSAPLDVGAISTWAGSSTLYLVKWYDQGGNANDMQAVFDDNSVGAATLADQPIFKLSGTPNGKPTVTWNYSRMEAVSPIAGLNNLIAMVAHKPTSPERMLSWAFTDSFVFHGTLDISAQTNGAISSGIVNGSWQCSGFIYDYGTRRTYKDQTLVASASASPVSSITFAYRNTVQFGWFRWWPDNKYYGDISEIIIANVVSDVDDYYVMTASAEAKSYYGL